MFELAVSTVAYIFKIVTYKLRFFGMVTCTVYYRYSILNNDNTEFKYICVLEKNTVIIRLMKFTGHIICNQAYV